jgi:tetratricopeptide (TPR) repeat protein
LLLLIYAQTRNFLFVNFDDDRYVYLNDEIKQGLTFDNLRGLLTRSHADLWHPLATLGHMIDVELFGLWAGGHHLVSVGWHIVATLLIYRAFTLLTGSWQRSALAAAIFALHPLRVESVAWVCERKDVLSGVMFGWLLIAYAKYRRAPSTGRYLAMLGVFALGCMAKPTFVPAAFVLLLLDYWPLGKAAVVDGDASLSIWWRRRVVEKLPLLAIAAAAAWATIVFQQPAIQTLAKFSLRTRLFNALLSYVIYVRQFFWPANLAALYPHRGEGIAIWEASLAAALLIGVTILFFALRRTRPYLIVGWLWYLGMAVPVIGLVQAGVQAHADRFTYLPQIGLAMAAAWALADVATAWRWSPIAKGTAATALALAMSAASRSQATTWADAESLFTTMIARTERNAVAHSNLSVALSLGGREAEALQQARIAAELDPEYVTAQANYGDLLRRAGRHEEALVVLGRTAELNPDDLDVANNLGDVLLSLQRLDEAAAKFEAILREDASYSRARINLGLVRFRQGRFEEAVVEYRRALELRPNSAIARSNLGLALMRLGRRDEAVVEFRRAIELRLEDVDTLLSAASLVATTRSFDAAVVSEAVEWAKRAVDLTGRKDPRSLDILAATLAAAGRFREAIAVADAAYVAALESGRTDLAEAVESHRRSYRNGQPITE